jgi:hypothetical protein
MSKLKQQHPSLVISLPERALGKGFAENLLLRQWQQVPEHTKEDKTMHYTKPDVGTIGQAVHVIENYPNGPLKIHGTSDPSWRVINPAYDLDE